VTEAIRANALVYLDFLFLHGEWRDVVPRRGDARDAVEMLRFYLFVRKDHPHQESTTRCRRRPISPCRSSARSSW
jgi:hypothetical protein